MPGYISEKKKQFSIPFAVENVMFFFFNLLINDLRKPKRKLAHGKQKLKVPKIFYIWNKHKICIFLLNVNWIWSLVSRLQTIIYKIMSVVYEGEPRQTALIKRKNVVMMINQM